MIDIPAIVKADCEKRSDVLPHKSNWASQLGDPCLRRLIYQRVAWDKVAPPSAWLQGRFDTGNTIEDLTVNYLNRLGMDSVPKFRLVEKGFYLNDAVLNELQIGGRPDCALQIDGQIIGPVEIKSCNPNIFAQLKTIESMDKYRWMRNYKIQLTIYEFGMNAETGFFGFVNTNNHKDIKWFELPYDNNLMAETEKKAKEVNSYLKNNQLIMADCLPPKINLYEECGDCPFAAICCPEYTTGGDLQLVENPDLEGVLDRLDELKPMADEIAELEKSRDEMLNRGRDIIVGNWIVMWKKSLVEVAAKAAYTQERWAKKIIKTK